MSDHAHAEAARAAYLANPISIPFVLLIAVLCGAGIFLTFVWLMTFDWIYFSGIALLALGAFGMFSQRTGAQSN